MSRTVQPVRIIRAPSAPTPQSDDEHVVLRLAREALRGDPPTVRFIGRSGPGVPQGAPPWLAFD
jgi:hypothetical protein